MIAELDIITLYEEMASLTDDDNIRATLLDIAKEEKIHIAMFQTVLLEADSEFLEIYVDYSLTYAEN
ncbi:MAG: rubrerythrin [Euryarchaeota archaeon]|nr:rubrerythrin [Euryarchaeota archaeon]